MSKKKQNQKKKQKQKTGAPKSEKTRPWKCDPIEPDRTRSYPIEKKRQQSAIVFLILFFLMNNNNSNNNNGRQRKQKASTVAFLLFLFFFFFLHKQNKNKNIPSILVGFDSLSKSSRRTASKVFYLVFCFVYRVFI